MYFPLFPSLNLSISPHVYVFVLLSVDFYVYISCYVLFVYCSYCLLSSLASPNISRKE